MLAVNAITTARKIVKLRDILLFFGLSLGLAAGATQHSEQKPDRIFNNNGPYRCNYAKVNHLQPGSHLTVRLRPSLRSRMVDKLADGAHVYICDEHADWYKVFYGGRDAPCGTEFSNGIEQRKTLDCKSGWVNRNWIDVTSG